MADVFVSYNKQDRPLAERVAATLTAEGISVWWDNEITPKEAWDTTIEKEIAACSAVVVLWSPRSVLSDWVRTEAHFGQRHGKLVPAMIERCDLPIAFLLTQTVNLAGWEGDRANPQWRKLLTWIVDLGQAATSGETTGPKPVVNRFRNVVGQLPSGEAIVDGALVNAATPAGAAFRDEPTAPAMRIVGAGDFIIGASMADPDRSGVEGPQKRIEIPAPFAIGVFPVLRGQYEHYMGAVAAPPAPAAEKRGGFAGLFGRAQPAAAPAVSADPAVAANNVSFDDAVALAEKISASTGQTYRLPSESEWEYACRAGSKTRYHWGDTITPAHAVFRYEGVAAPTGPAAPGGFAANNFGLFDMHGNVREWTADLWHESYESTPLDGSPALDGHASMRVVRGGGWSDPPYVLRSSARNRATQTIRADVIGLRLVRVLV